MKCYGPSCESPAIWESRVKSTVKNKCDHITFWCESCAHELQIRPNKGSWMRIEQTSIEHTGDCSIYGVGVEICDCGAFRRAAFHSVQQVVDLWPKHLAAIERSKQ